MREPFQRSLESARVRAVMRGLTKPLWARVVVFYVRLVHIVIQLVSQQLVDHAVADFIQKKEPPFVSAVLQDTFKFRLGCRAAPHALLGHFAPQRDSLRPRALAMLGSMPLPQQRFALLVKLDGTHLTRLLLARRAPLVLFRLPRAHLHVQHAPRVLIAVQKGYPL